MRARVRTEKCREGDVGRSFAQARTGSVQWQIQVLDVTESAKDLAKVILSHISGQFLNHDLPIEFLSEVRSQVNPFCTRTFALFGGVGFGLGDRV